MPLTAGRSATCTIQPGGVVRMALASREDVASITVGGTDNDVTAIAMDSGKLFYTFSFQAETLRFTEEGTLENLTSLFVQKIAGTWQGWSQADRKALLQLYNASACGMVCIAELENLQTVIFGINPEKPTVEDKYIVRMESSNFNSGATFSDQMKNDLVLTARSSSPATKFTPGWAGVPLT